MIFKKFGEDVLTVSKLFIFDLIPVTNDNINADIQILWSKIEETFITCPTFLIS